jgi:hypothetical protein
LNGTSSSTSDFNSSHHQAQNQPSSTVSALTTLTRKSTRRQQTKNVSFQPSSTNNIFNNLFQNNSSYYHENTSSTFSTLPKQNKRDQSSSSINNNTNSNQPVLTDLPRTRPNDFPTLQTILNPSCKSIQPKLPQPPPLLNGIFLLDKMLNKSSLSNDEKTHTLSSSSTSNSGWYNVTSNYQTRASIV